VTISEQVGIRLDTLGWQPEMMTIRGRIKIVHTNGEATMQDGSRALLKCLTPNLLDWATLGLLIQDIVGVRFDFRLTSDGMTDDGTLTWEALSGEGLYLLNAYGPTAGDAIGALWLKVMA